MRVLVFMFSITVSGSIGILPAGAHLKEDSEDTQQQFVPDEVVIGFYPGMTELEIEEFYDDYYAAYGLEKKDDLDRHGKEGDHAEKLATARGFNLADLITILEGDSRVEYAEPNYIYTTQLIPNDPGFGEMWGLDNTGQTGGAVDADIDAPEAWDISPGVPQDILVAVIDTGVDYTHEDLVGNMWVNPGEIAGNGIDDDGNGYIDDIHGINAITDSGDPMDDNGHGTHVSGTIGAEHNNGVGTSGASPYVRMIACKFLGRTGSGTLADATKCLHYINHLKNVLGRNIRITNNSWSGGGFSQALQNAFAAMDQPGMAPILHVVAAGNSNLNIDVTPSFPAAYDLNNMLTVAATDHSDNYAFFQ